MKRLALNLTQTALSAWTLTTVSKAVSLTLESLGEAQGMLDALYEEITRGKEEVAGQAHTGREGGIFPADWGKRLPRNRAGKRPRFPLSLGWKP